MKKIGITGNIASGKSTFENILKKSGFLVYDYDKIVDNLYKNDADIQKKIIKEFNTLDKKNIADIVFNDKNKKTTLENIIYPKLKEITFDLFEKNKKEKIIFISAALLFEGDFNRFFDKIIFIDAPKELRLQRLKKRNSLDEKSALIRINAQKDIYKSKADFIVVNDKSLYELENQAKTIIEELLI